MQKQVTAWIVIALMALSVGAIGVLGSRQQGSDEATASAATARANEQASALTPDLTKVDAYSYLDLIPVGKPAPDFKTVDATGKPVHLSDYRGKKNVVLVFYQGSFCGICGHQLETIQSNIRQIGVLESEVLAISADDASHAKQTLGEHGLTFPVIPDPNRTLIDKFGVRNIVKNGIAWPAVFVLDKTGTVRLSYADPQGQRLDGNHIVVFLNQLKGGKGPMAVGKSG
jgi:peroxiredoxin